MESIAQLIGISVAQLTQLATIAAALLVGLFLLRVAFKLTASLLRIGCIGIVMIIAVVFLLQLFSG